MVLSCNTVCCSVLQCVAVQMQCGVVRFSVLQCAAMRCSAFQCDAVDMAVCITPMLYCMWSHRVAQCVAVCRSVLQYVAVCCSMSQCVAVRCSALQYVEAPFPFPGTSISSASVQGGQERPIGCLNFTGHFPQKSPVDSGYFSARDLHLEAFCASLTCCACVCVCVCRCVCVCVCVVVCVVVCVHVLRRGCSHAYYIRHFLP